MYKSRARAIRAVMLSNPANETIGVPLDDLAEALQPFTRTRVTSWMLQLVANGDVIQTARLPSRFKWIQGVALEPSFTEGGPNDPFVHPQPACSIAPFTMPQFGHDWR